MKKIILIMISFFQITISDAIAQSGWFELTSGTENWIEDIYFIDENVGIACGRGSTILKTIDGGITWDYYTLGNNLVLFDVFMIDENIATVVGLIGTILRTTDGGETCSAQNSGTTEALQRFIHR
jgi:photosystem II stability/assembly factor-like uncharacterized protein